MKTIKVTYPDNMKWIIPYSEVKAIAEWDQLISTTEEDSNQWITAVTLQRRFFVITLQNGTELFGFEDINVSDKSKGLKQYETTFENFKHTVDVKRLRTARSRNKGPNTSLPPLTNKDESNFIIQYKVL